MDAVSEAVILLSTLSSITVLKVYVSGTTGGAFVFFFSSFIETADDG